MKAVAKKYKDKNNEITVNIRYPICKINLEEPESEWKECECGFYLYIKDDKDSIMVRERD